MTMNTTMRSLLISLGIGLAAISCDDGFLDLEPKLNELEANAYQTETDAFEAMTAVYDAMAVQNWNFVPFQSDIISDDQYTGGEPGGGFPEFQEMERSVISTENSAAEALWSRCYSGIYRANFYLYKEPDIDWQDDGKRNRMKAEVQVLRAYFYWDLASHFGWVPVIREFLSDPEAYKSLPQEEPEAVYQFIAQNLLEAIPSLPATVPDNEKGRITKDVAYMLMARIYLHYEGFVKPVIGATSDWSDGTTTITKDMVRQNMEDIITSGRYQLLDTYSDIFEWDNENNEESIFEYQYSDKAVSGDWGGWGIDGNFSSVFYGPRSPEGDASIAAGWSFGTISWSLYDEFEASDPRREATAYDANTKLTSYQKGFQNTGYFSYKYMPRSAFRAANGDPNLNWPINFKDMRLAEAYLIAAELYLDTDPTKATLYLNEVRTRAMGDAAALSAITMDDIFHERRVEFGGEGRRKWDLLRQGLDMAKQKIDASWVVPLAESPVEFQGRQFDTDTWGMLPIPASEIRLVNEGYLIQHVPAFQ